MNNTTNKTEPLNLDNPITVLGDGETFDGFNGTMIAFPPADMDTDEIEELLKDNMLDTFTFGSNNNSKNWSLEDVCKVLELMLPDYNVHIRTGQDTIRIQEK